MTYSFKQFVQDFLFRLQHLLLWTLKWLSYMSEIPTCPAITNRSEKRTPDHTETQLGLHQR